MTATAGELIQQTLPLPHLHPVVDGKTSIFPGTQSGMGNIFAFGCRIAAMAVAALASLRIVGRMARQAELPRLLSPYRGGYQKQGNS